MLRRISPHAKETETPDKKNSRRAERKVALRTVPTQPENPHIVRTTTLQIARRTQLAGSGGRIPDHLPLG
jgi:hypothetical protein